MTVLLHPGYFPSIAHFVAMAQNEGVMFEKWDNYQKQTYRTRTYIYGANGRQILSIPIKHVGGTGRQPFKDVHIENDFPWQKEHWKGIQSAYRTSPFFEYYEDEFVDLFTKKQEFLMDFNLKGIEIVMDCLQMGLEPEFTDSYQHEITSEEILDARKLIVAKGNKTFEFTPYTQVFEEKNGYLDNLSILDLLFNEGTNALTYLEEQTLSL